MKMVIITSDSIQFMLGAKCKLTLNLIDHYGELTHLIIQWVTNGILPK